MSDTPALLTNIHWLLLCSLLIMFMQIGFVCLESGLTRAKHSINVAIKNLADFCVAIIMYGFFGFSLMFGNGNSGWFGDFSLAWPHLPTPYDVSVFMYQAMFCCTAATIVSGAIAERTRFVTYLLMTLIIATIIYPVVGHWIWGGAINDASKGWLYEMGFVDFAGATVVHSVGGWVALAAVIIIGPRIGRFDNNNKTLHIPGHSAPLAIVGGLLMFTGWFGFNGGSLLGFNEEVPSILLNTLISAVFGACTAMLLGRLKTGYYALLYPLNGMLSALVAITACAHVVSPYSAAIIGAIAGTIYLIGYYSLLRLGIDDVVGAIPTHLAAGIWGTLSVALFAEAGQLQTTIWEQLWIQTLGVIVVGLWTFGSAFILLSILNKFMPLRASVEQEFQGLNFSEHRERTAWVDLLEDMQSNIAMNDLAGRVRVEPYTEIGQIASEYNRVMDLLERNVLESEKLVDTLADALIKTSAFGEIQYINPAGCKLFGVSENSAKGSLLANLFIADEATDNLPTTKTNLDLLVSKPRIYTGLNLHKEPISFEIKATKQFSNYGLSYTLLFNQYRSPKVQDDLTIEENPQNDSLEKLINVQLNQRKSAYIASLSQRLRTPLNLMLSYQELLQQDDNLTAKQREHFDKIELAANQVLMIMNDIIQLTDVPIIESQHDPHVFDLHWLIEQINTNYGMVCAEKGLQWQLDSVLDDSTLVFGEPIKLQQILSRLINNAVQFTDTGSVKLNIRNDGHHYTFVISDTGKGMSGEQLYEISNPVQHVRHASNKAQHGLIIVHQMIKSLHGKISFVSQPRKGTQVTFTISLAVPPKDNTDAQLLTPEQQHIPVWVIDEREQQRFIAGCLLRTLGLNVFSSQAVSHALKQGNQLAPRIIFISQAIADFEQGILINKLAQIWPHIKPSIVVIRESEALNTEVSEQVSMEICWPISINKLVDCINKISKAQSQRVEDD